MADSSIRYKRCTDIFLLAIFMESKPNGVSIKDIQKEYSVSRSTAIRMLDSLRYNLPHIAELGTGEKEKRWGFTDYYLRETISFTPEEIAALEQIQNVSSTAEMKEELHNLTNKVKALSKKTLITAENRIELMLQTEGYAIRQVPHYKINPDILETIREAIENSKQLEGVYHNKKRLIEPLGIIYSDKVYLVAREKAKGDIEYLYILHKFEDLKLTNNPFDKGDFDLKEYTSRSFGVFQELDLMSVKLWFSKEVADDVKHYNFHPTQKLKEEEDGSVILTFKACGSWEIIWHVLRWGKNCKILAPKSLQKEFKEYIKELLD